MRISVYEDEKRIGFICLTKSKCPCVCLTKKGQCIHSKYVASIHLEKSKASIFKDDFALSRGLTIAQRCFPGRIMDIEI